MDWPFTWMTPQSRSTPTIWNGLARHSDGTKELDVQLDRSGRQAYRHRPKPAGDMSIAQCRSVRLSILLAKEHPN